MLLNDLLAQTRMVTVKYGDGELNIEYYRQKLFDSEGKRLVAAMQAATGFNEQFFALACEHLTRVIAWWDLYESEGVPLGTSVEALNRLPMSLISDVFVAIMGNESNPNPPTITVRADV